MITRILSHVMSINEWVLILLICYSFNIVVLYVAIGPPAKMNPPNLLGISNEPNQVHIQWTKPDSYGAALIKYI